MLNVNAKFLSKEMLFFYIKCDIPVWKENNCKLLMVLVCFFVLVCHFQQFCRGQFDDFSMTDIRDTF